jgi:Zn-dependent protease
MGWWAANLWQISPVLLVSWVFWVIFSITLHELAHGWTAIRHGDDTPVRTGHMSVNPLVHMGPISLIAFALVGIAWGAMPVDPSRLKGRHADAMVAGAGPVMNLGLALICVVLGACVVELLPRAGAGDDAVSRLWQFFSAGGVLNILLAIFNMVPIPPLDGSRVLASFSRRYVEFAGSSLGQGVMFIGFAILFFTMSRVLFPMAFAVYDESVEAVRAAIAPAGR